MLSRLAFPWCYVEVHQSRGSKLSKKHVATTFHFVGDYFANRGVSVREIGIKEIFRFVQQGSLSKVNMNSTQIIDGDGIKNPYEFENKMRGEQRQGWKYYFASSS